MAQLNITLNQDEILQLLGENNGSAFRVLLQETLNAVLSAESTEQLQAQPYERTSERLDSRNGTRERSLCTRIGTIDLKVPRHRNIPFKTLVFDNYQRSEAALVTTMAEMVVAGVSTAKVGRVMEEICGKNFSKQAVSVACHELDDVVSTFRGRPLGSYLFVIADATYIKVRENHRIVSKALMIATGITDKGIREVIGVELAEAETKATWTAFFQSLHNRGLCGVALCTSDAHEGLISALHEVFPDTAWQRCQAHFMRNIIDVVPKKWKGGLRAELNELFNFPDLKRAQSRKEELIADYQELAPEAMEIFDAGFDDAMTIMQLPREIRRPLRTSNYIERLNREIKRRTRVIGIFPTSQSALRLTGACLMQETERWQTKRPMFYKPTLLTLETIRPSLEKRAKQQAQMRKVM